MCLPSVHLPLFILLFWKLAGATYPDPKKAGMENKSQWQAIVMPNGQLSIWRVKNEKLKAGEYKQWTLENDTLI